MSNTSTPAGPEPKKLSDDNSAPAQNSSLTQTADEMADSDLTSCDREPITRLERIQSFGFLIAMNRDWIVVRVSNNLENFLGISSSVALGAKLDALIHKETLHEIRNRMTGLSVSGGLERLYRIVLVDGKPAFDIAVHYSEDFYILEGERSGADSPIDAASLVGKYAAHLSSEPTLDSFHRYATRQLRLLTGYHRVMIYRLSVDGPGEVIAESIKNGVKSFLGLHYPASDIPVQARALYLKNSFRSIADVGSTPVSLVGYESGVNQPLDLSFAITRSVSFDHIEYLTNMEVGASASISIVVEGRLWGLIACHNEIPMLPTLVIRSAAELFGQMYSMKLESRLMRMRDDQDRRSRNLVSRMVKAIASNDALLTDASWLQATMNEMISCDGIVIVLNGVVTANGVTPEVKNIQTVVEIAHALSPRQVFFTDHLALLTPSFQDRVDKVAGVLCIPISSLPGDYVLFFRCEQVSEMLWAGDPTKSEYVEDNSERLTPRKNFTAFLESIRGKSRPFDESDDRIAENIRSALIEIVLRGSGNLDAEQKRSNSRQELLVAELNHRVRNVLSLIRGLISQTQGESGDAATYAESLNGRVQALSRAHDRVTRRNWGPGPLNAIFDDEIAAYVPLHRERFTIVGPPVLLHPQAYSTIALIVHELVTNSSKYGALSDNGRVEVGLSVAPGKGLNFKWHEIGGPLVKEPTRRGFGSVIIERIVPFDLQGTAVVAYLPAGLEAEFTIPERYLAAAPLASILGTSPDTDDILATSITNMKLRPLEGMAVLLVEDNFIVAMEAEELLKRLGASSVTMVATIPAASAALLAQRPDFAVLDINLGSENTLNFASVLRTAAVPFIFASGYGDEGMVAASQGKEILVSKPYDRDYFGIAVINTLAASR